MANQDLTPQLRTRLSHVERWVALFVTSSTLLLLVGLAYYVYQVAANKGWFLNKVPYHTYLRDATGLRVGDPVKLMGFDVGEITEIEPMPPYDYFNIYLQFRIKEPYYGYLLTDSQVKVGSKDLLGSRYIEVTKGSTGVVTVLVKDKAVTGVLDHKLKTNIEHVVFGNVRYVPVTNGSKGFWLPMQESPALTERLEQVVNAVEKALPNFLGLTNDIAKALTNVGNIVAHADVLLVEAKPAVTNLAAITLKLSQEKGALGEMLLPPAINTGLVNTLGSADATLQTARNTLSTLSSNVTLSLENVANLTSNLNAQVQANNYILSSVSTLVGNVDEMVQGLKRHWLLKGAFNALTNETPTSVLSPRLSPLTP